MSESRELGVDLRLVSLHDIMQRYMVDRTAGRTQEMYKETLSAISRHLDPQSITPSDLTTSWVAHLDAMMQERGLSSTTRSIHLRNLRTTINYALQSGLITSSPFNGYRLPGWDNRRWALPIEAIRALVRLPLEGLRAYHRDMFLLTFGLIGINTIDLYNLPLINNGRAEYIRAKTKRPYSIKVEPEMRSIIERYAGANTAVNLADRYASNRVANVRANRILKSIGSMPYTDARGEERPISPKLSTYWARHTWATIAAYLDIPKDTIAAALGHGVRCVTDIYIDFDRCKIDQANRKVLDWVYYSKM